MFARDVYVAWRKALVQGMGSGLVLLPGNREVSMNYPANPLPFRQDSDFRYFFGLDHTAVDGLLDLDEGKSWLVGEELTVEDVIWMGELPRLEDQAASVGLDGVLSPAGMKDKIGAALRARRPVHFLPPYRGDQILRLSELLGLMPERVKGMASMALVDRVIALRSVKGPQEIEEMTRAVEITAEMYQAALAAMRPGSTEQAVVGAMQGAWSARGAQYSFPPIVSVRGQILHNHDHSGTLREGQLLLIDSGAESPGGYAGDITRTYPVTGRFDARQKAVYETVLRAQKEAIAACVPGRPFREIHLLAARVLAEGLREIGLIRGAVEDVVAEGAHALFFPHGLGHMIGMDVHDMEGLGEQRVGYAPDMERSGQFGLAYLRLARPLQENFVVTVEPGLYFIPALIGQWQAERRHEAFIRYDLLADWLDFGGVRIEDDVWIRAEGPHVLGPAIPKEPEDIAAALGR